VKAIWNENANDDGAVPTSSDGGWHCGIDGVKPPMHRRRLAPAPPEMRAAEEAQTSLAADHPEVESPVRVKAEWTTGPRLRPRVVNVKRSMDYR